MLSPWATFFLAALAGLLALAAFLHLLGRLGPPGRALSAALCRAPGLDLVVTIFTIAPLVAGPIVAGWAGLAAALAAQVATVMVWTVLHELAHPAARRGPRIVHSLNRSVGRLRNHTAVWWTAWAVPIFFFIRVAQYLVYPPLTWLIGLPRYRAADWINVSRHKFTGLVGHDLIWCLYCDWMTGVWSLGGEMLRNVESFWCPIRFDSAKKCENCRTDFPDIAGGWVPATADIADAAALVEQKYPPGGFDGSGTHPWFGHPARLTVQGRDISRKP
ncbi:MAG: hypothetical protein SFZ24_03225 [Planctomycetota bacterium]|nr:hypothetical protein [Planctomycetota bacterium]